MIYDESLRSEKAEITRKKLRQTCQKFADALAGGRWFESQVREIHTTRSYTDSLEVVKDDELVSEIHIKTEVGFYGTKEVLGYQDNKALLEEQFRICATVRSHAEYDDLPEHIIDKLKAFFEHGAGYAFSDADEDELTDDADEPFVIDEMALASTYVEREQELGYVIDDNGDMVDYYLTERFYANGDEFSEEGFAWSDEDNRPVFEPTSMVDRRPLEWRQAYATQMSEADVTEFMNSFEKMIQGLITSEAFDDITEEMEPSDDEHRRRAMAMLAMVSSGYKGIKL